MKPEELTAWRGRMGYRSKAEAAAALGCSRRTLADYEEGTNAIPRYVALACRALEDEQKQKPTTRVEDHIADLNEVARLRKIAVEAAAPKRVPSSKRRAR